MSREKIEFRAHLLEVVTTRIDELESTKLKLESENNIHTDAYGDILSRLEEMLWLWDRVTFGDVTNKNILSERHLSKFFEKVVKRGNCWEWTASVEFGGYGSYCVDRKFYRTHRLSYMLYKGEIPSNMNVCHTCDNRLCVNPDHLFLGSQQDNMDDKVKKNRQVNGERMNGAKLKDNDIPVIRERLKGGLKIKEIANEFNVSFQTISLISRGKTWRHVQ